MEKNSRLARQFLRLKGSTHHNKDLVTNDDVRRAKLLQADPNIQIGQEVIYLKKWDKVSSLMDDLAEWRLEVDKLVPEKSLLTKAWERITPKKAGHSSEHHPESDPSTEQVATDRPGFDPSDQFTDPDEPYPGDQSSNPDELDPGDQSSNPDELDPGDQSSNPDELDPGDQSSNPDELDPGDQPHEHESARAQSTTRYHATAEPDEENGVQVKPKRFPSHFLHMKAPQIPRLRSLVQKSFPSSFLRVKAHQNASLMRKISIYFRKWTNSEKPWNHSKKKKTALMTMVVVVEGAMKKAVMEVVEEEEEVEEVEEIEEVEEVEEVVEMEEEVMEEEEEMEEEVVEEVEEIEEVEEVVEIEEVEEVVEMEEEVMEEEEEMEEEVVEEVEEIEEVVEMKKK
ncbi:hypothetical protein EDB81DRAFT_874569 [Dactylonectria macrodidyma]|uniref:Uncharacterized protein n=1 Tax=Dactylonectria macrodidyma TaxID=307937 RepID=A0A9P9FRD6_9HYPO|nr:hypothetical protein EDB81DRAFT_874569 [Dactylonectria macrodidyma]